MKIGYAEARELIKDGDAVFVHKNSKIVERLISFFTHSPYSHVGIAIWIEGGLYLAELNGGRNHLIPMSQLRCRDFDVFEKPDGLTGVRESIFQWLRATVDYAFLTFIPIGILNFFGIKFDINWRNFLVCSGFCVAVYEDAGWPRRSRVISPKQLADQLSLKIEVENHDCVKKKSFFALANK